MSRGIVLIREYAWDLSILLVSYLIATYLRRQLPLGRYVGTNYQWHEPRVYLTIALGLALAYGFRLLRLSTPSEEKTRHLLTVVAGVLLSVLTLTLLEPRQSGLQKIYFMAAALILICLLVPFPARKAERDRSLRADLAKLWANRALITLWIRFSIQTRYTQALLGILWIVLLPLTTALVMSLVFSQIMRVHINNAPFIAFFLAGFIPWGLFNQSVNAGMRGVVSHLHLINQVYFPREIIILSALGEAIVDMFFMLVAMIVINAIVGVYPNWHYIFLIPLIALVVVLSLGAMLIVGWLGVLVRDVPQLVSVILQIMFYLSAVIYPVSIIPPNLQFFITLNPMAVIIDAFHEIIVYNASPDWYTLIYPSALAIGVLVFGYRLFKANEDRMADML